MMVTMSEAGLNPGRIAAYAVVGLAIKALTLPLLSYLPPVYAAESGLPLATIGMVFMMARLWDIIIDPVSGYIMDRLRVPLGRRKFWMVLALPLLLGSIPLLFNPGPGTGAVGLCALLFIFYLGWTLLTVAHAAWPSDLASSFAGRARLIGWREWAGVLGMMGIVAVPTVMESLSGAKATLPDQVWAMGVFALVVTPLTVAAALLGLPDRRQTEPVPIRPARLLRIMLRTTALRRILAADLLAGGGFAVISATSFFIIGTHLGLGGQFSTLMFAFFIGMVVGVPVMLRVSLRLGPQRAFAICMGGAALATLALLLAPKSMLWPAFIIQLLSGLFTGGYQTNLNAAMAMESERSRRETALDTTGSHFAFLALTNKLGYALAIGMAYPLLQYLGFGSAGIAAEVTGAAHWALLAVGGGLPAMLLAAAGIVFHWREPPTPADAVTRTQSKII